MIDANAEMKKEGKRMERKKIVLHEGATGDASSRRDQLGAAAKS